MYSGHGPVGTGGGSAINSGANGVANLYHAGGAGGANSGGGAAGGADSSTTGAAGGSGCVILRMLTADEGSNTGSPTRTTSGSDTILTFTGSGTYTG